MTKLDASTLNVLCNAEVIDIDQDTLGKQARDVWRQKDLGLFADSFNSTVAPHDLVLVRLSKP